MLFLSKFGSNTNNKLLHLLDCSFNLSEKRNAFLLFITQRDDFRRSKQGERGVHRRKFLEAIRACGMSFSIWTDIQGNLHWTSLMGNERKKLLMNLPLKFPSFLPAEVCDKVTKLWKVCTLILNFMFAFILVVINLFILKWFSMSKKYYYIYVLCAGF